MNEEAAAVDRSALRPKTRSEYRQRRTKREARRHDLVDFRVGVVENLVNDNRIERESRMVRRKEDSVYRGYT